MRIAFDPQAFAIAQYGGISRYFYKLIDNLIEKECVDVKVFAPIYINEYIDGLPKEVFSGLKIAKIQKMAVIRQTASLLLSRPFIHRYQPHILHETYYSKFSYKPEKSRRVVTVYDMIHERYGDSFSRFDTRSRDKITAVMGADHVICISENTRHDLLEYIDVPLDKISVIHLGVDSVEEKVSPPPFESSIKQSFPYILYVGQRGSYKNFNTLVKAYAASRYLLNHIRIICFGGGKFTNSELSLFDQLNIQEDQIQHVGGGDEILASYYRNAAAFVYPSLYEGFGLPPLEAMTNDCAVICSNVSSIPEVVGDAGEYFDPEDIDSIISAIENVVGSESRCRHLIEIGKDRASQFTWDRCANKTLDVYKSLL
ncbi:MAG: glycosyltransferase family 1 protein [Sedimenticola sp.]